MTELLTEIKRRCLFRLKIQSDERLEQELDWFHDNGGEEALIMMSDFARHLSQQGIFIGAGSKFECCSLVCYGLGITNINPLDWSLPFKPFADWFKEEKVLCINTSDGGAAEQGFFKEKTSFVDINGCTAHVTFLDDKIGDCLFVVEEYPELNLLKAFQEKRTDNIRKIKLDEALLKTITDEGFAGFSLMANARMKPMIDKFQPDCFSDFCILFSTFGESKQCLLEKIINAKKSEPDWAMENSEKTRILAETYGVPLYQEQIMQLETLEVSVNREIEKYPSKAVAISVVTEAIIATSFKNKLPEQYKAVYEPIKAKERERRINQIGALRKKLSDIQ